MKNRHKNFIHSEEINYINNSKTKNNKKTIKRNFTFYNIFLIFIINLFIIILICIIIILVPIKKVFQRIKMITIFHQFKNNTYK